LPTTLSYYNKIKPSLFFQIFLQCYSNLPKMPFSKFHLLNPSTNLYQPTTIPPSYLFYKNPPVPIKLVNLIWKTKLVYKIQNKCVNNFLLVLLRSRRKISSSVLGLCRMERISVVSWETKKYWKKSIKLKLELKIEIRKIIIFLMRMEMTDLQPLDLKDSQRLVR